MRQRFHYLLLFGVPALLASGLAALVLFAGGAGLLWLFVYGDDAWPESASFALATVSVLAWLAMLFVLLRTAFRAGQRREAVGGLPKGAIGLAAAASLVMVAIVLLQQRSVGNLGPKSDSALCSDHCLEQGARGSSMPPRNAGPARCSCIDAGGHETAPVPIADLRAPRR